MNDFFVLIFEDSIDYKVDSIHFLLIVQSRIVSIVLKLMPAYLFKLNTFVILFITVCVNIDMTLFVYSALELILVLIFKELC